MILLKIMLDIPVFSTFSRQVKKPMTKKKSTGGSALFAGIRKFFCRRSKKWNENWKGFFENFIYMYMYFKIMIKKNSSNCRKRRFRRTYFYYNIVWFVWLCDLFFFNRKMRLHVYSHSMCGLSMERILCYRDHVP